ncbi:MAG: trypsin-like serine protease [Deltaproteobacteria bacterium]
MATRDQPIIRGSLAASAELDHTGALIVIDRVTLVRSLFCTATLIAPETLVTAKHCALSAFEAEAFDLDVGWLVGPAVSDAAEVIPIVAVELAPLNQGGFLGIGRDVAVAHLEHPTTIPPVEPRSLEDDHIGQAMLSIGYGVFSPIGTEDQRRRIGSETVTAVRGRVLAATFGSFESYVEWSFTGNVTDFNYLQLFAPGDFFAQLLLQSLRTDFDSLLLLDGYEAVTGREPGDTQTCSGDSGGPLALQSPDGSWQTYGVVSGGPSSATSVCDYGSVFATFGPETLAFLEQAASWVDACGELPRDGECQGSLAVRCETGLFAGVRRLVARDCAATGQECFLATSGVACHEPLPADEIRADEIRVGPADEGTTDGAAP